MADKPASLTREQIHAEIDTLENFYAPYGVPKLHPRMLILIDQVAAYISEIRGELPDPCAGHLHQALLAATKHEVTQLVTHLGFALSSCDRLVESDKQSSSDAFTQKPIQQHTDKLLEALQRKKARIS